MSRLEILNNSLVKKEKQLEEKFETHFATVKQANGQPLNDKRNGQATLNKWEKQSDGIRNLQKSIEKTKNAIEKEKGKIANVENVAEIIPLEILEMVKDGVLNQWRKYPHIFFVNGIDKARIIWDNKLKIVAHKHIKEIQSQEQRTEFARIYNRLFKIFNSGEM